jgi:RNA polymerase sigma-70 factor (ECF subfamily)
MNKLMDVIKHLPDMYRNVISLYLFEGYDHDEISQILSIPSNTSRSHFSRARRKLVKEFKGR